jgi:hypothetical protein
MRGSRAVDNKVSVTKNPDTIYGEQTHRPTQLGVVGEVAGRVSIAPQMATDGAPQEGPSVTAVQRDRGCDVFGKAPCPNGAGRRIVLLERVNGICAVPVSDRKPA